MKKKRITYGVSGMMEYQCLIRFGRNMLKVTFTGGSMNAIGVTPATYTTNSFLIQQAIENSNEFKRGRIRIVNTIELDEELHIERGAPAPATAGRPEVIAALPADEAEAPDRNEEGATENDCEAPEEATGASQQESQERQAAVTQVEFACNDDAKDYLEQTFGHVRSKLRNREDIISAGKTHNVEITFA